MITLIDALNLMEGTTLDGAPIPFQMKFFTKDGDLIEIPKGVKVVGRKGDKVIVSDKKHRRPRKDPRHHKHSTRNILIWGTDQIRKVKIRLITEFNGQQICY